MLKIQEFIKQFPSIIEANYFLKEKLHLKIKPYSLPYLGEGGEKYDEVYVYNYDMIESPRKDPIVKEARGLILDSKGDIVSISFSRFFNYNEPTTDTIDWSSARAEEKYDGSLVVIYNHRNNWFIQTRSEAMAAGPLPKANITFKTAVKGVLSNRDLNEYNDPFRPFDSNPLTYCYVFEFISPWNRIVTPYSKSDLILLTIIDKERIQELDYEIVDDFAHEFKFRRPFWHPAFNLEDVLERITRLQVLNEGFVVVDDNHNRLKVKNPGYLAVSRTVSAGRNLTLVHFADMALTSDITEIKSYFPEYTKLINVFTDLINQLIAELNYLWAMNSTIKDQKEFAMNVKEHPLSGFLFAKRSNRISSLEDAVKTVKPVILTNIGKKRMNEILETELANLIQQEASEYAN